MKTTGEVGIFGGESGLAPMPSATGIQLLHTLMQQPAGQYMYGHGDTGKIKAFLQKSPYPMAEEPAKGQEQAAPTTLRATEQQVQEALVLVFADVLGLPADEIELGVLFEEYGIDSIMINQFNVKLENKMRSEQNPPAQECQIDHQQTF